MTTLKQRLARLEADSSGVVCVNFEELDGRDDPIGYKGATETIMRQEGETPDQLRDRIMQRTVESSFWWAIY